MDEISKIFAAIDGSVPEKPFASFTADGGAAAVAAGRLGTRHYVAYLLKGGPRKDLPARGEASGSYVAEDLRLYDRPGSEGIYRVLYLEVFDDPFKAGERYRFFWEALHPTPAEDATEEEMERDGQRGLARIGDFIRRKRDRALFDEALGAEEQLEAARTPQKRAFWEKALGCALEELGRRYEGRGGMERDLGLHRLRRAAEAKGAEGEGTADDGSRHDDPPEGRESA